MRGNTSLDNYEYDQFLAENKMEKELRRRKFERRNANKGYKGFHFGLGDKPVYTKDKEEFKRELQKRNLMMRDDVRKDLR